jgi:hypothetical protein
MSYTTLTTIGNKMRAYIEGQAFTVSKPFKEDELGLAIDWCYRQLMLNGGTYAEIFNDTCKLWETGRKKQ